MALEPIVHVIDDDEAVRESLGILLTLHGFAVACYASAEAFLALPRGDRRGCIVSDLEMPGLCGLTLLQRIAAEPNGLPVVLMTGRPEPRIASEAERLGALALLRKPFSPTELLSLVRAGIAGA